MESDIYTTKSEEETIELGKRFAERLQCGDVVTLYGELGAGKTEFVKGICQHFDVEDLVSSPTYTIINQYEGLDASSRPVKIYHVDLFRIKKPLELEEIGFEECMYSHDSIKLVEWAEKAFHQLPEARYAVSFTPDSSDENLRSIEINHLEPVETTSKE